MQTNESGDLNVTIAHNGGDTLEKGNVRVTVEGEDALDGTGNPVWDGTGEIIAGDSVTVDNRTSGGTSVELSTGDRLTVVWTSDSGRTSAILREYVLQ